jgi:hypothetical protein
MEQHESTISSHGEKEVVRGLTNKLDVLKSATLELDEQLLLVRSNRLLSKGWANNALLEWIDSLVDEIYERTNEIVGHVVENNMLKEEEE